MNPDQKMKMESEPNYQIFSTSSTWSGMFSWYWLKCYVEDVFHLSMYTPLCGFVPDYMVSYPRTS